MESWLPTGLGLVCLSFPNLVSASQVTRGPTQGWGLPGMGHLSSAVWVPCGLGSQAGTWMLDGIKAQDRGSWKTRASPMPSSGASLAGISNAPGPLLASRCVPRHIRGCTFCS